MSKILANEIANYGDNAPIDLKEGLNIPAGKPIQTAGLSGTSGQVLSSTGTTVQWITPFSGNYNSLTNKPTIPAAQINSDWNASSGVAVILNKPTVPPVTSLVVNSAGTPSLTFNGVNGQFTYTPPDLSNYDTAYGWGDHAQAGYLTSLGDAAGVTTAKINNWDTAFGWGNHASAGYLQSYTETDPVFNASPAGTITLQNKTNWNTAYGWGNHATAGYLTTYTETDPVFLASAAAGVTTQLVSNWNTAYTWGDHGVAGYLTNLSSSSVGSLSDVVITGAGNGQLLQYNGTNWVNITPTYISSYTETDTLASVTARGASTTIPTTFLNLTLSLIHI